MAALGERGEEVQYRPIGDELERHVTILTGDVIRCKSDAMASPVEQVTYAYPGTRRDGARLTHYLAAALLARTADEGARVALVILALDRTDSAAVGGTLVATLLLPHVVAAPLVGALVDRSRRPAAVLAGAIAVFAAALAAPVALLGHAPLWQTCLVLAMAGCCGPALTGGLTSRLAALAGPGQEARAFALDSLSYSVAGMLGPATVGLVAAAANPGTGILALAVAAVLGALGVASLRLVASATAERKRAAGLFEGARAIARVPALRTITLTTSFGQLGLGGLAVVATTLAAAAHEPTRAGLLLSVTAGGAFVGSLLWAWRPLPASLAPRVTVWAMAAVGVPLTLAAAVHSLALAVALFALSGLCTGPFAAALFLARNQLAAEAIRTQVFTIGAGLKVAASAIGAGLLGLAAPLSASAQLLLVAAFPIVAGIAGGLLLRRRPCSGAGGRVDAC
ncbi:MFS transporter [Micromonospora inaquosa]|uniref:MFS transporter n=2 Tax=Micromonospora inaquosa TaxID=2203716 RepID=A0A3N9WFP9_9ACTN|nr:MFS transporter [Micromonospora inaquosa]